MKSVLKKALLEAQEADVFWSKFQEVPVYFEANQLKSVSTRQGMRLALRLVKDGKTGGSTCTNRKQINSLVSMALDSSSFGPPSHFSLPEKENYPGVKVYDREVGGINTEELINMGQSLLDKVARRNNKVLYDLRISKSMVSHNLLNSRGADVKYKKSSLSIDLEGTLIRGTDMLFVGDSLTSCRPIKDRDAIVDSVLRQLDWAQDEAKTPTGVFPAIFLPRGMISAFLIPLAAAFNGRMVLQGASALAGRLGEKAFDGRVSLYDDATVDYNPASKPCDDEGIPVQKNSLIEKGQIISYFYDLQTAGRAGRKSTGNGHRAAGAIPSPWINSLVFAPGEASLEEMIADIKEGVVIEQLMGAEQGNVLSGEFAGNILLGYKIEKGRIAGRIKNAMLSGNIYNMLKEVTAIGKEGRWVGSILWTPPFYFSRVSVAAKGS